MHYEETTLAIIKQKIIKTDEVLQLLVDRKNENAKLTSKYQTLLTKYSEKCTEVSNIVEEKSILQAELRHCKSVSTTLEAERNSLKALCKELEGVYNSYVNKAELRYQTAYNDLSASTKNCEQLQKRITKLEEDLEDKIQTQVKQKRQRSPKKSKEVEDSKLTELINKNEELEAIIRDLTAKNNEDLKQLASIQRQLNILKNEKQGNNFNEKNNELQKTIENMQTSLEKSTEEIKMSKLRHANEVNELTLSHRKELNSFTDRILNSKQEEKKLKHKLSALELENKQLNDKIVEMQIERNVLNEELEMYLDKNKLSTEVGIQTEESDTESVEHIFLEMQKLPKLISPLCILDNDGASDFQDDITPSVEDEQTVQLEDVCSNQNMATIPEITITPPTPVDKTIIEIPDNFISDVVQTQSGDFIVRPFTNDTDMLTTKTLLYAKQKSKQKVKRKKNMKNLLKLIKNLKLSSNNNKNLAYYNKSKSQDQFHHCTGCFSPYCFNNVQNPYLMYGNNINWCGNPVMPYHMPFLNPSTLNSFNFMSSNTCMFKKEEPHDTEYEGISDEPEMAAIKRNENRLKMKKRNSSRIADEYDSFTSGTEPEIARLCTKKSNRISKKHKLNGIPLENKNSVSVRHNIDIFTSDSEFEAVTSENSGRISCTKVENEKQIEESDSGGFKGFSNTNINGTDCRLCITRRQLSTKSKSAKNALNVISTKALQSTISPDIQRTDSHSSFVSNLSKTENNTVILRPKEYRRSFSLDMQKNKTSIAKNKRNKYLTRNSSQNSIPELFDNIYEVEQRSIDSGYIKSDSDLELSSADESDNEATAVVDKKKTNCLNPNGITLSEQCNLSQVNGDSVSISDKVSNKTDTTNLKLFLFGSDCESSSDESVDKPKKLKTSPKPPISYSSRTNLLKRIINNSKRRSTFYVSSTNNKKKIETAASVESETVQVNNAKLENDKYFNGKKRIARKLQNANTIVVQNDCTVIKNKVTSMVCVNVEENSNIHDHQMPIKEKQITNVEISPRRLSSRLKSKALRSTGSENCPTLSKTLDVLENGGRNVMDEIREKRIRALEKLKIPLVQKENKRAFKRPQITKRVPYCPKSPESEEKVKEIVCIPKVIPLEKPAKITKAAANELWKKLISFPTSDDILQEVCNGFYNQEPEHIAGLILEQVYTDIYDTPDTNYCPAPIMTERQRLLLGLMIKLESTNTGDVCNAFMSLAEQRILLEKELTHISPVIRLYLAVCKFKKDINRMRRLCFDALYFMGDLAIPLLYIVFTNWFEILPRKDQPIHAPLVKVLAQIVYSKNCDIPGYNFNNVKSLLMSYYGYEPGLWHSEELITEFLEEYIGKNNKTSEYAILLLCKNLTSKWAFKIINTRLKPIISQTKDANLIALLITLIGRIVSQFKGADDVDMVKKIKDWLTSLATDTVADNIKSSLIFSLNQLPKPKSSTIWCS